jgi:hypothetical protein
MFRRIELIFPRVEPKYRVEITYPDGTAETWDEEKRGLFPCAGPIARAVWPWVSKLRGPECPIPRNAKFYFTERGWREIGRHVVAACKSVEQQYRVIRVKECEVDVVWRDRHYDTEVAAQPRKKKTLPRKKEWTS